MRSWRRACLLIVLVTAACSEKITSPTEIPSSPAVPSPPKVDAVNVVGTSAFFQRGQTAQLSAEIVFSNGFAQDKTNVATWQSTNAAVANVSPAGLVTAGDEGQATVSATYEGVRGNLDVQVKYGFRAPDPPPGQRLPVPDMSQTVRDVAALGLLASSCQDFGGTWDFMDTLVDRLRQADLRWGYNGRRGDPSFPGRDEVAYHWGPGPDLNSRDVYVFDAIAGHCGPNPQPGWIDISNLGGVWLSRGRF